ncbi:MAG: glycosyltransferase family 87 protein [Candidatus Omnitrophota bacterium]
MNWTEKRRLIVVIILSIILFASLIRYGNRVVKRNYCDFNINYMAGERMLQHENLYDFYKSGLANFKYPPFFACLMMPLAGLDEFWASIIWFIVNFILLVAALRCMKNMIANELSYGKGVLLYFLTTIISIRLIFNNFDEGQVNVLMMAGLIFSIYFLIKERDLTAAYFFAFSALIKYMPLIMIPYFIFKRRYKFLIASSVFLVIYSLIPAIFIGWGYNLRLLKEFIPFVFSSSTDTGSLSTNPNQSLLALLMRFLSKGPESNVNFLDWPKSWIILIFAVILAIFYLLIILERRPASRLSRLIDYGLILVCIALFNLNAWLHAFIFLIFGYMILLYYLIKINFKDKFILGLLSISFIFNSFAVEMPVLPKDFFETYSAITLSALLVFCGLMKIKFGRTNLLLFDNKKG